MNIRKKSIDAGKEIGTEMNANESKYRNEYVGAPSAKSGRIIM
jgi:hypothetical protein